MNSVLIKESDIIIIKFKIKKNPGLIFEGWTRNREFTLCGLIKALELHM